MKKLLLLVMIGTGGFLAWRMMRQGETGQGDADYSGYDDQANYTGEQSIFDMAQSTFEQVAAAVTGGGPASGMTVSSQLRDMLKRREKLMLNRYDLGDGGYTIGYGHFETNINNIPASITVEQAEAMFDTDIYERAEKWVRLYVTAELTQNQYDALVHIAYNMSPGSFKKFANSVNAGQGINDIAQQSVAWVAAKFTNGIQTRRNQEMNLYNSGVYA